MAGRKFFLYVLVSGMLALFSFILMKCDEVGICIYRDKSIFYEISLLSLDNCGISKFLL